MTIWEYERKEVSDKRFDVYLAEKGAQGWDLVYCRRGKQTRVNTDPDWWEVVWKRPKAEVASAPAAETIREEAVAEAMS